MSVSRRHFLALTGGAALAWDFVCSGSPEQSPNYRMADHWWGMLIDITKCIGCGNCVRACAEENDVPEGYLPHLGGTLSCRRLAPGEPASRIAQRRHARLPGRVRRPATSSGKDFFVPKMCNHCADSPCVQVCPVGATFVTPDGVVLVDEKYCLGCRYCIQACPYGCRFLHPTKTRRAEMHALLSPHHQGPHHGLLRSLPHRRAPTGGSEESEGSRSTNSWRPTACRS